MLAKAVRWRRAHGAVKIQRTFPLLDSRVSTSAPSLNSISSTTQHQTDERPLERHLGFPGPCSAFVAAEGLKHCLGLFRAISELSNYFRTRPRPINLTASFTFCAALCDGAWPNLMTLSDFHRSPRVRKKAIVFHPASPKSFISRSRCVRDFKLRRTRNSKIKPSSSICLWLRSNFCKSGNFSRMSAKTLDSLHSKWIMLIVNSLT